MRKYFQAVTVHTPWQGVNNYVRLVVEVKDPASEDQVFKIRIKNTQGEQPWIRQKKFLIPKTSLET